ncbi:GntR family transcriptional regulator [Bradyrhizobium brasilense]|uniref:GntR family transcriptional regulator n=1 Tax=Bradyrhizobium brasilense TaxID=1419277 RepID=UPI0024B1E2DF|nr:MULTISPECIES: GntR family transcriptional regulator [Bradyrhizobium]MCP3419127.1 GntR family transcriptional regulator [Bradyrhizobium brasilense]WFU32904.1 GntR family transcriptional regulator [Bradyrhizobium australafricanum]
MEPATVTSHRGAGPHGSAPDAVREALRAAISSGELAPGLQLRQDELAARFGTSRIPVREALRQLEAEGFVTFLPNRGAVVSDLSIDEVIELLEIRIALECHALRLAIPAMGEIDLEEATKILRAYDAEPDPAQWGAFNWKFHATLYAPCNRPRLLGMIEANYGHVGRFTRALVSQATGKERPQREHYRLLEFCRDGEVKKAVRLLRDHIEETQKTLRSAQRQALRDAGEGRPA